MKEILLPCLSLLLCVLLIAAIPTELEAAIYDDTVRLHILAPSDSAEDQALKLLIRDKILEKYSSYLAFSRNASDAKTTIGNQTKKIESDCRLWILEAGYSYSVEVELVDEWYETREYKDFTLPAGYYSSLKVSIGEGKGQNWWCVMYPPLCLECALGDCTDFSDEEYRIISESGYNVKFKLLELSSSVFGRRK